jgi:hypothetical protein
VTVGQGVKRAGIDGDDGLQSASIVRESAKQRDSNARRLSRQSAA